MNGKLQLEIVTPFGKVYESEVNSCVLPGAKGQFQVLKNHAPVIATIGIGPVKVKRPSVKETELLATSGGFCEVRDNVIKVIVESAEKAEEINIERAEKARERAEERLSDHSDEVDEMRARIALERAINRIQIAKLTS